MGQMRKTSKKGFTVAELLIVVGIIAVLVAIAIPVFRHKAEKAKEAYDIYTMRQAASAAIDLYYMGIHDESTATNAGLLWNKNTDENRCNAYGIYDPATGGFIRIGSGEYISKHKGKPYGKGTKINGGTEYTMGGNDGTYDPKLDYTNAVVMVAIYPLGDYKHVDIYWKYVKTDSSTGSTVRKYVGGEHGSDNPKLSIRIPLN